MTTEMEKKNGHILLPVLPTEKHAFLCSSFALQIREKEVPSRRIYKLP
ncbi:MAG: hypothetical protein J6Y84_04835 [Bacteroidaceae bacterium]|nr:hypothetical protein [Bacteroidaceae bacterium]